MKAMVARFVKKTSVPVTVLLLSWTVTFTASAQTITSPSGVVSVTPADDFATQVRLAMSEKGDPR